MQHIAIMNKKLGLISKILSGEKTIESRFYVNKVKPWQAIFPGEAIYFKESGGLVSAKAIVDEVIYFENFNRQIFNQIVRDYGSKICLHDDKYSDYYKSKRFVILIKVKKPEEIPIPFEIDKTGFGNAAAWITVENVSKLKLDA